jgi:hypothetical protein
MEHEAQVQMQGLCTSAAKTTAETRAGSRGFFFALAALSGHFERTY